MKWFCWHKWPKYGKMVTYKYILKPRVRKFIGFAANFKCLKCGRVKSKRCNDAGKLL